MTSRAIAPDTFARLPLSAPPKSGYCLVPMHAPDPITETITARLAALHAGQRLSAWSLIVSFLGDAIGPRGGVVSAGALQTLMQRLGVGHGAVRTALSRLAADGWIERDREGRNSFYRLSGDVVETVLSAERRIYAQNSLLPAGAPRSLVIAPAPLPDATLDLIEAAGALQLSPQVFVCFAAVSGLPAALYLPGATVAQTTALTPGAAMLNAMEHARQAAEMARLHAAYLPVAATLKAGPAPPPEDAMALRCLMIHEWRRLALRVLAIPADLVQPTDPEPETRALIAAIYARLLPASENWLDANASTPSRPLPPPDARLARRFGGG
ncbi:MAG: PaaX family transcriptional regulator C-terminal domain-containing protein [Hoeflea sp.]|uniref:PaaX family transcriptional regulator C-terminal domain-containing protein n=1 Tax=Hoeflea sp. TaxID=1940281 RepID=UPI0032969A11